MENRLHHSHTGAVDQVDPMIGQQFGHLKVIKRGDNTAHGAKQYICACVCGNGKEIRADRLRSGNAKSCGCVRAGVTTPVSSGTAGQPFVEQMRANFYFERPTGGKQFSFVMVKDIVGQRVATKTEHGYFLTTAAYRPTTPGRINTIVPIMMKRLYEAGIVSEQGKRTVSAWMHDEGIKLNPHMRGSAQYLANEHAKLSIGDTDECN